MHQISEYLKINSYTNIVQDILTTFSYVTMFLFTVFLDKGIGQMIDWQTVNFSYIP